MTRYRRPFLAAALILTGCASVPETPPTSYAPPKANPPRGGRPPTTASPMNDSTVARGLITDAKVARKEAPTTLIEMNAWTCEVTEQKFAETKVGDTVRCLWNRPATGARPSGGGRP